jgi:small GTP-binding protein
MHDYLYKIIVIGDSGVGKSNLVSMYVRNEFTLESKSTLGVDFGTKIIHLNSSIIKMQIWDTAGQERFRAVTSAYYRGSVGCLLVYDITNKESYSNIVKWLYEIREHALSDISIVLIGNKNDLTESREISTQEAAQFAIKENLYFLETSALMNTDIDLAFSTLINDIYKLKNSQNTRPTILNFLPIKSSSIVTTNITPNISHNSSNKCCF